MKKYLLSGVVLTFLLSLGSFAPFAHASSPLMGWAWSSNVGWISFSSNNPEIISYGGSPYSVTISTSTVGNDVVGTFSGYAWSSNVGWISFNSSDLTSAPACPGSAAQADLTTGKITGFIRALSGVGDWGGCIELSDTTYHTSPDILGGHGVTYQVSGNQGLFNGFAWEGINLGWISFAPTIGVDVSVINPTPCTSNCGPTQSVSVSCSPTYVTNLTSAGNVTFSASAGGGSGSYLYSWGGGTYGSSNTTSIYYSATGYGPTLTVEDANNHALTATASGVGACGNVAVGSSNPGVDSGLKLMIATPNATLSTTDYNDSSTGSQINKTLSIDQGQTFKLQWNLDPSVGYDTCHSAVTAGSYPLWGAITGTPMTGNATLPTTGISTGTYTFYETCSVGHSNSATSHVVLTVKNSSEGEI